MSTVGLSFGSITSGNGIDVTATVNQILAIEQQVEAPWKNQLAALQAQDTVLSTLGTDLSALSTALQSLTDFSGVFASKQGSSSNTDALVLTSAATTASAGSHSITIQSLAQTSSAYSQMLSSSDTVSGTFTVQVGTGTTRSLTIPNGSSLSATVSAINGAAIGVRASIIKDASGSRLSLVSTTSGAAGQMTLGGSLTDETTGTSLVFQQGQQGKDAQLSVDGIDIATSSNTVTDVIPGVTFQLLATTYQDVSVQITNNNTAIESAMSNFVAAYNAVAANLKSQEGKDASGNAQPLYGSPTLALIQNQLASGLLGGGAQGTINNIGQLGLMVNRDGTLAFDASAMDQALNSNFDDVMGFLQNTGKFGQTMTKALNGLSSTLTSGTVYLALQQNKAQETALNENISRQEVRIAADKVRLTSQLNSANQILQSLPDQLNQVDQLYNAITGYNRTT